MQFKHPELLYALFLLLIPILVHLFQLRKFKKVAFTNVAFLKDVTIQTRKSSQLKKWLILFTRMLLLACIVLAFAQPFTTKNEHFKAEKETVIYLDNSFSMQAKGDKGELLKRAIQDILSEVPEQEKLTLFTNDQVFKNTSVQSIKNELLLLNYSSNTLSYQAALLKSKTLLSKQYNTLKHVVFISDFQEDYTPITIENDSSTSYQFVKLNAVSPTNIAIDSVYISNKTASNIELKVLLKNSGNAVENVPVSLYNANKLIAKTATSVTKDATVTFTIPSNETIHGKIVIDDSQLQFDNTLFFNINSGTKVNVLSINATDDRFLKRIFTKDEFNYTSTSEDQLNYTLFDSQNLVVLNELNNLPKALSLALKQFTSQGGSIVIIPSTTINNASYNDFLMTFQTSFAPLTKTEKRITNINYAHPLYNNGVFEKQVNNFQYPKVNSFFSVASGGGSHVLKYEDGKPFLVQSKNVYLFTSALNSDNSSFKNSPLIVPTLYNIGKFSLNTPELYYTIGKPNTFSVNAQLQQDDILSLAYKDLNIIPEQQHFKNKVVVKTSELPSEANTYALKNKAETIKHVSFNYSRNESDLVYKDLSSLNNISITDSITDAIDTIKSDAKVNALWKWFVIFAGLLLVIEMGILKYYK